MTVRAKFHVDSVTDHGQHSAKTVKLSCKYDNAIPEDQRFSAATPFGSMELSISNPVALAELPVGQYLYVDFTPIEG